MKMCKAARLLQSPRGQPILPENFNVLKRTPFVGVFYCRNVIFTPIKQFEKGVFCIEIVLRQQ